MNQNYTLVKTYDDEVSGNKYNISNGSHHKIGDLKISIVIKPYQYKNNIMEICNSSPLVTCYYGNNPPDAKADFIFIHGITHYHDTWIINGNVFIFGFPW